MRELGLVPIGGNYFTINRKIAQLNLDTSHFTGQLWSKGKQFKNIGDLVSKDVIKKRLLDEQGNKCASCNRVKWLGKQIKLELHHKDGDQTNNERENIELLCPNCHSFTDTWRKTKDKI
jgi:5-methylcytosine-specific restriction endonuclease McrA